MTGQELTKLWELYPEARNLYEQYNGILVEDDPVWKELTGTAEALIRKSNTELCTTVIWRLYVSWNILQRGEKPDEQDA